MGSKKKSKMGRPSMDNPKKIPFTLRLTPLEMEKFERISKSKGISISEAIMLPHRKGKK